MVLNNLSWVAKPNNFHQLAIASLTVAVFQKQGDKWWTVRYCNNNEIAVEDFEKAKLLAEQDIKKQINRRIKKLEKELSVFKSEGFFNAQNAHTGVANIIFDWKVIGENCGEDKLGVHVLGHYADCYKAYYNQKWSVRVDYAGTRGFECEASAKSFAEAEIRKRVQARIDKAQEDLALFTRYNVVATPKPSGQYLSLADFKVYIENNLKPALEVVGTNLRNPNKLNQAAARALGFSSYEALQPLHHREEMITNKLYVERCPYQNNMITIKAANIIVVFDALDNKIRLRALKPGQECELVTDDNEFNSFDYDQEECPINLGHYTDIAKFAFMDSDEQQLDPQIEFIFTDMSGTENIFICKRTYEGIITDVIYDYKANAGSIETNAVAFEDAECDNTDTVDQANATLNKPVPTLEGEYYQWMKPVLTEDGVRYLKINEGEEMCISELMFESPQEAIDGINDESWGAGTYDVEDAVLLKYSATIIGNGNTLCPINESE